MACLPVAGSRRYCTLRRVRCRGGRSFFATVAPPGVARFPHGTTTAPGCRRVRRGRRTYCAGHGSAGQQNPPRRVVTASGEGAERTAPAAADGTGVTASRSASGTLAGPLCIPVGVEPDPPMSRNWRDDFRSGWTRPSNVPQLEGRLPVGVDPTLQCPATGGTTSTSSAGVLQEPPQSTADGSRAARPPRGLPIRELEGDGPRSRLLPVA
jgi:hypothetical protein